MKSGFATTCAAMAVALFIAPGALKAEDFSPAAPAAFQFGEGIEAHAATFESLCTAGYNTRTLETAEHPMAEASHIQVDCEGFEYYGAPRLAEFVFADDALTHVWVLTGADDLPGMTTAFEASFGAPSHDLGDNGRAWVPSGAAVRFDVPEALYFSEAAAPFFGAWFDQMAGGGE